jgi:hypothetical protein
MKHSDSMIRRVLISRQPSAELAERYQCSTSTINRIRRGEYFTDRYRDLPRWGSRLCNDCKHWLNDERCGLQFPDALQEGPLYARDCSVYERRVR